MAIDVTKRPKVSLTKVVLEKTGDSHRIDLSKAPDQNIVINLNWTQQKKTGLIANLFGGKKEIDLDLGCFYELRNGQASLIDGLQFSHNRGGARNQVTRQGCYTQRPWIWHCGDDRGGSSASGENILVNPQGISDIRRMTIYCFIYEGVARWDESDAVVTVKVPNQPDIVVEMGKQYSSKGFCAIAEIEFGENRQMIVRKAVTFHDSHKDCDRYYDWGFEYSAGSK